MLTADWGVLIAIECSLSTSASQDADAVSEMKGESDSGSSWLADGNDGVGWVWWQEFQCWDVCV